MRLVETRRKIYLVSPNSYHVPSSASVSGPDRASTAPHAKGVTPDERIVEDVMRYPLVIDKIVAHKGGVVPDFCIQHAGCSRRKRKLIEPSRMYEPPPEVATIAAARHKALREQAAEWAAEL